MAIWRYIAVEIQKSELPTQVTRRFVRPPQRRGELAATSSAEVRQSLRRIGLQAIEIRPAGSRPRVLHLPVQSLSFFHQQIFGLHSAIQSTLNRYLCKRRSALRAELYDSLATMIESGLPLAQAFAALSSDDSRSAPARSIRSLQHLIIEVRTAIAEGTTLAVALRAHPDWFNPIEIAMVEVALRAGTLSTALRNLADREARADQLTQRLIGALMYPCIVMLAAIGVTIFLSVKTLPDLTTILVEANVAVPPLTAAVMAVGRGLASHGTIVLFAFIVGLICSLAIVRRLRARILWVQRLTVRLTPGVWRSMTVGVLASNLAELVQAGIPIVDACRILAPTMPNSLHRCLNRAADRIEEGSELVDAFGNVSPSGSTAAEVGGAAYFTAEFRRLLEVGQVSGNLAPLLDNVGQRYQRQAMRRIDRLASILEPCAIITLALLVGTVVMAAVLPLVRLQEVIH